VGNSFIRMIWSERFCGLDFWGAILVAVRNGGGEGAKKQLQRKNEKSIGFWEKFGERVGGSLIGTEECTREGYVKWRERRAS